MRVHLLGGFSVDGRDGSALGSRKARTLLKLLALRVGTPVPIDAACEVLWADEQPARPAEQLGVLVSRLRRVLGADTIRRVEAGYALHAAWVDVQELRSRATAAADALRADRLPVARAAAEAALDLVRGPLLPGDEDDWLLPYRAAVAATVTAVRRVAVEAAVASGDVTATVAMAEQVLVDDPYDEHVLRALMTAHLSARRPASALDAYARLRRRLAEDLGVSPTAETEHLHRTALEAADGDDAPSAEVSPARATEVPGREAELARLDGALERARTGETVVVLVTGDAGMGKTALVEAWVRHVAGGVPVLRARCDELGRDLPLQPVVDALASHVAQGGDALGDVLGDEADRLAPLVDPWATPVTTVVDPEVGRAHLFGGLARAVATIGGDGPVVLAIDDLHLAGASTLGWIGYVRVRSRRLVLLLTARPPLDVPADIVLPLGPIDLAAITALVGDERGVEIHDRTGGHPLLVSALIRADADVASTGTVESAVARQLASLPAAVQTTIRAAAPLGFELDLDLLAAVTDRPATVLLDHLESSLRSWLVVTRGGRFGFRHELVRAAVDATLSSARRAHVHRVAAQALAAHPDPDWLEVAVHARMGGDAALAASAYVTAAEAAAGRFDLDAAEAAVEESLALAPSAGAYSARARIRMSRQDLAAAAADAAQAVASGGGARSLEIAGWVAYYRRRYLEAEAFAREALIQAQGDEAIEVSARALAGRVRHGIGDLRGAVDYLAPESSVPVRIRGIADVWLAQARLHQGRPVDALAALSRPSVDPDGLAHPWAPLHLRFNRVMALGQLGQVEQALAVAAELDAAVARAGSVGARFRAPAANISAWILRWSGRSSEADERNRQAIDATGGPTGPSAEGFAEGHYVALLDLADGALLAGDLAGAAALAARLEPVDAWSGTMAWHQRHRLGLLRARIALAEGDPAVAAGRALEVVEDCRRRGAGRYELLARAVHALADPAVPASAVVPVVEGLGRCAALDGWPLVAALAAARDVSAWREEARRRGAALVTAAGPDADTTARFVDRVLRQHAPA